MGKVESLALGDKRGNLAPSLRLGSIGEKVHDDGTLVDGLRDVEESLSGNPTVLLSLFPRLTALSHTDNDLEAVVTGVEGLTVTLGAIANHGESVILEVATDCRISYRLTQNRLSRSDPDATPKKKKLYLLLELVKGPVSTLVDNLFGTGKVESLDTSSGLQFIVQSAIEHFNLRESNLHRVG